MIAFLRCCTRALGTLALEWAVGSIVAVLLVVGVHVALVQLTPAVGSGPAMCVAAAGLGLLFAMVAARWEAA